MHYLIGRHEVYTCELPPLGAALPVGRVDAQGPQAPGAASRTSGKRPRLPAKSLFNLLLWGLFGLMFVCFSLGWSIAAFALMGLFMFAVMVSRLGG
jgi:hypothetical protein